ncbi:MAG: 1-deoxy-D-xylulose-5-phosphate reductoisomerase [Candidatus Eiseniibacteriota bacterium]|jgi:1-deoxy-D-xylulose-5-phosphate reductoisomerase
MHETPQTGAPLDGPAGAPRAGGQPPRAPGGPRRLVILGATGSVGRSALEVAARHPGRLEVVGLAACRQGDLLAALGRRHGVSRLALFDEAAARRAGLPGGAAAVAELAALPEADCVLNAIVGARGLEPSLEAVAAGKLLALANKESLVIGGELLTRRARAAGATIVPVDSEHNAAMQLLRTVAGRELESLVLTASGGPFRSTPAESLRNVSVAEVLDHPTWSMGPRITVDSATLLNKGFEVIEARWLFELPLERIEVVVHPESIVHALIRLVDGSVLANLSSPDMRVPIQLALSWPDRWPAAWSPLDLKSLGTLTFEAPDGKRFPALGLAMEVARRGGTAPAVLNAADEELIAALLAERLAFADLPGVLEELVLAHTPAAADSAEAILAADQWARRVARERLGVRGPGS